MPAEAVRTYLLHALEAAPLAFAKLTADGIDWDRRPDPERFTMREVAAHLADWESIWQERVQRLRDEENPFLASVDEGLLAEEHDYASRDPRESVSRYVNERGKLVPLIRSFESTDWDRKGYREFIGDVTFTDLVATIVGHDGYHLKQAVDAAQA